MCVYDIWAIVLFIIRWFQNKNIDSNKIFGFAVIFLLFLMCFRSNMVGPDLPSYVRLYLGTGSAYEEVVEDQPVLMAWIDLLRILPTHPFVFVFFTTILTMFPVILGIKLYSKDRIGSLLAFMIVPGIWMVYLVTIRQALSQFFLLMGLIFVLKKYKHWKIVSIICVLFALFSHSTSYLIIPLLLIVYFVRIKRKWMIISIFISLFFTNIFSDVLGSLFYKYAVNFSEMSRLVTYFDIAGYDNAIGRLRAYLPMSILCCWCLYCNRDKEVDFFENSFFIGVILYNLLGGIDGHLIDRFCNFFYLLGIIGALPKRNTKWPIVTLILLAYIFRAYNEYQNSDFIAYKFIWE